MPDLKIVDNGTNYSLLLLDFHESEETFSEFEHEGGGYDWQSVVSYLINRDYPQVAEKVKYDSESSMFVAYGDNIECLMEVEKVIRNLVANQELLKTVIQQVPEEMWD